MSESIHYNPIGRVLTAASELYSLPFQPDITATPPAIIELDPHMNYEMALEDLKGFNRIWLIFHFDKAHKWRPKVKPPRGDKKRGVFATRSPHRPNAVGISSVELIKIEGRRLYIANHDLINGTPILDIKPYIAYADSHPQASNGWLDECQLPSEREIIWSPLAQEQASFIKGQDSYDLQFLSSTPLQLDPRPEGKQRIDQLENGKYRFRCKTWSLIFSAENSFTKISIEYIESSYDEATLTGEIKSRWPDVPIHRLFNKKYQ